MPLQSKVDRGQIQFFSLDEIVDSDSVVRVVDLFCKCIDYQELDFTVKGKSHEGKPAFETKTLTAIYIYGYLNKVRSCRTLEKACKVNSELWWLTGMQRPGYMTIANFRKDIMLCYNLKRVMKILGIEGLKEALKSIKQRL